MASRSQFRGIKLLPGKPSKLQVPEGEYMALRQVAFSNPAKSDATSTVTIKTSKFPELVVCTLRRRWP